jgi:DNA (cytosine-5)-methyltransferase 1
MKKIPILSFFSGGGFLDIGFEQAGFDVAWTNEHDTQTADAYAHGITAWKRSINPKAISADITCRDSIRTLKPSAVIQKAFGCVKPDTFGVIGGPPCTDFSAGGQNAGSSGKHGRLSGVFVKMICGLQPDFFVIENVPRLLRDKAHSTYLNHLLRRLSEFYEVKRSILSALELGAPQDRDRLFIIGIAKRNKELANSFVENFKWPQNKKYTGAKSWNWPRETPYQSQPEKPHDIPEELFSMNALGGLKGLAHLPNGEECFVPYSKKFWKVPEGRVSAKSFKRLHRYRYSPTVWYGNNEVHLHPWESRRLTLREAMRLQTIPDSYEFSKEIFLSKKFKVVSNGVPCMLAHQVASGLSQLLVE